MCNRFGRVKLDLIRFADANHCTCFVHSLDVETEV
jgi:hypothetical protein